MKALGRLAILIMKAAGRLAALILAVVVVDLILVFSAIVCVGQFLLFGGSIKRPSSGSR